MNGSGTPHVRGFPHHAHGGAGDLTRGPTRGDTPQSTAGPPNGRGRARDKGHPPAPLGFEWRAWDCPVTWRRAIGSGGAMTSCPPPLRGGRVRSRSARPWPGSGARARRYGGSGAQGGSVQPGSARFSLVRLGSVRFSSVRLGAGGGSRAPSRLLSSGGRGSWGCPEPRSGNGLRAVAIPSPTPPPHRGVGPVRGAGGRRG